eukprot:13804784-Heterocapsa_arctica.AAC.1
MRGRDADACIRDAHLDRSKRGVVPAANGDLSLSRKLQGVHDQVIQHLRAAVHVRLDRWHVLRLVDKPHSRALDRLP